LISRINAWSGAVRFVSMKSSARTVELMNRRLVNVAPLISATFHFQKAVEEFEVADHRSNQMKVALSF